MSTPDMTELQVRPQSAVAPTRVPTSRYTSAEFARREARGVFGHAWQMACREEEIPNVGDYLEYVVADQTYLITRSDRFYHQRVQQRLSPPGQSPEARDRKRERHSVLLPRLVLEPRRLVQGDPGSGRLRKSGSVELASSRVPGRVVGGLCLHQS
jgi:hypothetical protein